MKDNRLKIYSVAVSVAAAILLLAVIIMAVSYHRDKSTNDPAVISAEKTGEYTAEETGEYTAEETEEYTVEDQVETAAETEVTQGEIEPEVSSEPLIQENQNEDALYNAGGLVGWEQGNDAALNIVNGWKNMLSQLDLDVDIAFLGDSITQRGDFRPYFPDKKVINLGCGGDTIRGVYNRAETAAYVHAEQVFVMCGVNELQNDNTEHCKIEYAGLLNALKEYLPDSECYICSILPMSQEWQDGRCSREVTEEFNAIIRKMAEERGMTYVDLYSLFVENGAMKPEYTIDGVHLSQAGFDVWMSAIYQYVYD